MADSEVGDLTAAGSLDGSELLHVVKGGNSRFAQVSALGIIFGADQNLTAIQQAQALANLGLVNNRVLKNIPNTAGYAASTDRHITEFDTDITISEDSSKVRIFARVSFERQNDGVFYFKRDGVEVGSAPNSGGRAVGITPVSYDNDQSSTMQSAVVTYEDSPGAAGTYTYSLHCRGASQYFALNRTIVDGDATAFERATSEMVLEEHLA